MIVYAKQPSTGYAKTRLGVTIGMNEAAGAYARLLYFYLFDLLQADLGDTRVEVAVTSPADVPFFAQAFPEFSVCSQIEGDLGQRMEASFAQAFAAGAEAVVLTGSDIPGLDSGILPLAFGALETAPLVIGPALDGGYYLLGMRAPGVPIFDGVEWSTDLVLAQTEALARAQGLKLVYLPERFDVDTIDDFKRWRQTCRRVCPDEDGQTTRVEDTGWTEGQNGAG